MVGRYYFINKKFESQKKKKTMVGRPLDAMQLDPGLENIVKIFVVGS